MKTLPYEYLNNCIKIDISHQIETIINSQLSIIMFHKGDHPIKMGDEVRCFYMIIEGLVRGYYINEEGIEATKCFSFENGFFGSECYRTKKLSTYYIECLEECTCLKIPYSFVYDIIAKEPKLAEYIQTKYLDEVEKLENRAKNILLLSAKERYLSFVKDYSLIHQRIPLKVIASYIGIKAGSLSRIRKTVFREQK